MTSTKEPFQPARLSFAAGTISDVTFDRAPDFARDVLVEAIGVPVLPVPVRVEHGRMGPPVAADILTLAAALAAASGLAPSTPVSIGGVSDGRGSVTAKVTGPSTLSGPVQTKRPR